MSLFIPDVRLKQVSEITPEMLKNRGIGALILDIDNTLAAHNSGDVDTNARKWLDVMKSTGIKLALVSNNREKRVMSFAEALGLSHASMALKPLPLAFRRMSKQWGVSADKIAVVGDQVFTDIAGGKLFGATTILVEPIEPEAGMLFKFKRRIEAFVLRKLK